MKVRDMFTKEFNEQYPDIEVFEDVTDEMEIAFCGAELTEEGKGRFAYVLDDEITIMSDEYDYHWVIVNIDDKGDEWEVHQVMLIELFDAAAGYCRSEDYDRWFITEEED